MKKFSIPGLPEGYTGACFTFLDVILQLVFQRMGIVYDVVLASIFESRRKLWDKKFGDPEGVDKFDSFRGTRQVCITDFQGRVIGACRLIFGKCGADLPGGFDLNEPCVEISRCDTKGVGLLLLILAIWEVARQEGLTFFVATFRAGFVEHLREFDIPIEEIGEPVYHGGKKFLRVKIGAPDLSQFVSRMETWTIEQRRAA